MIDTLLWVIGFIGMGASLGGGAALCVHFAEKGQTERKALEEGTKRVGMDNMFHLEQQKIELAERQQSALPSGPSEISFDLPGDGSWRQ